MHDTTRHRLDALERLRLQLRRRLQVEFADRRYRTSFTIPAVAVRLGEAGGHDLRDPAVLAWLDGVSAEVALADELAPTDPLVHSGVTGGELVIRHDPVSNGLLLVTEYRMPRPLSLDALDALREHTQAGWLALKDDVVFNIPDELPDVLIDFDPRRPPRVRVYAFAQGFDAQFGRSTLEANVRRLESRISESRQRIVAQAAAT